jgi:hypothetical protein
VFDATLALSRLGASVRSVAAVSVHACRDHPLTTRAAVMARAVSALRRALRESDVVYRNEAGTELLALMPGADARRASQVALQIIEQLGGLDVTAGSAAAPADASDMLTVVDLARRRTRPALYSSDVLTDHGRRPLQAGLFDEAGLHARTGAA